MTKLIATVLLTLTVSTTVALADPLLKDLARYGSIVTQNGFADGQ